MISKVRIKKVVAGLCISLVATVGGLLAGATPAHASNPWTCDPIVHLTHHSIYLYNMKQLDTSGTHYMTNQPTTAAPGACWVIFALWGSGDRHVLDGAHCILVLAREWYSDTPLGPLKAMCSVADKVLLSYGVVGDGTKYYLELWTNFATGSPILWTSD